MISFDIILKILPKVLSGKSNENCLEEGNRDHEEINGNHHSPNATDAEYIV